MNKVNICLMVVLANLLVVAYARLLKDTPLPPRIAQRIVIPQPIPVQPVPVPIPQPIPQSVKPKEPDFPPATMGLINAGKKFPGANVCFSKPHPVLMELAARHAQYMARVCVQGHQGFGQRFEEVKERITGVAGASEICAESWPWQANDSMDALGWEMFKCWKQSSGHWRTASAKHRYFGANMAKGRNGIWYACIIVAD